MPGFGPEGLFDAVLAAHQARPLVTYYDEATPERAEMSARSTANWVVKTHFLLRDELGLGVGDAAFVALPAHWISVPVLLGVWSAGLTVTSDPARAAAAFVDESTVDRANGVPDIFAISPAAALRGFAGSPPAGAVDYTAAVRPHPDKWAQVSLPASGADPALDGVTRTELTQQAIERAKALGLSEGSRMLTSRRWQSPADWIDTLLAPLAVGGSVVYVRNAPDEETVRRRGEQERADVIL